ncbi:acyltransferase [Pluralibacter gergoviae]|uniref:acyltransferase n=1 Tax=Pluralibacter gergoviae TaxID=61647 RepID=UPI000650C860|nr:acyltransferase [Pluralibacter gergoviae]KMK08943.1 acetyltransferase [Pluralibacter gergoviae]
MLYKIKRLFRFFLKFLYTQYVRRKARNIGYKPKVNYFTRVTSNTELGNNFNSNGLKVLGSGCVKIGDNFHCGFGCIILTENHNHAGTLIPYDSTYITKDTLIGDNVWFGINVIILPGVTIGEGAIIQAGSVVVKDVPELAIAGGHPAKVFSWRDNKHYFELKNNRLFH